MINLNIKKTIYIAIFIILNLSIASAAPLAKPSSGQIKKLIKKMLLESKTTIFTGIDGDTYGNDDVKCNNISVKKINLLKIGRASSNYYERSGNYINSEFKVKFTIRGACDLTSAFKINPFEYDRYKDKLRRANRFNEKKPTPVMPMALSGRVPFRSDIPYEVYFSTDDYGDWFAVKNPISAKKKDRSYSDATKAYLKKLFYKKNGSKIKTWEKEQIIAKNKLSDDAERGAGLIRYDRLLTTELRKQLFAQPKRTREFVFSSYWKLAQRGDKALSNRFLREVFKQMKLKAARKARGKNPPKKIRNSHSNSGNSHLHGSRRHSHKLPAQGKAHRHGGGPIGR